MRLPDGRDGDSTFVTVKFPLFDLEGNTYATCSISTDISDRVCAETALRNSELRYRSIFQNSQVGMGRSCFKQNRLFLGANQRCAEILGHRSATELIDKRFALEYYVNPDDRQHLINELEQQGEVRDFEVKLRRIDGSIVWALISLKVNVEANCTDFVLTDISERKRSPVNATRQARPSHNLNLAMGAPIVVTLFFDREFKYFDPIP